MTESNENAPHTVKASGASPVTAMSQGVGQPGRYHLNASDVADFIEDRLNDDTAAASVDRWELWDEDSAPQRWDHHEMLVGPRRWLAAIATRRRLLELHRPTMNGRTVGRVVLGQLLEPVWVCPTCSSGGGDAYNGQVLAPCPTLRVLAAEHADHRTFRPEWLP